MSLPITAILGVRRYRPGAKDSHGNPVKAYGDAQAWPVWFLAPGGSTEPAESNRDLSLIVWDVGAPADDKAPGERDLVVLDGNEYEVDGRPSDYTRGPWSSAHFAGVVVNLKRAEG